MTLRVYREPCPFCWGLGYRTLGSFDSVGVERLTRCSWCAGTAFVSIERDDAVPAMEQSSTEEVST